MKNISISDILQLPVQEKICLVELIWDSVAAVPEAVEISPALKAELEVRLAEFEKIQTPVFLGSKSNHIYMFMAFRLKFSARPLREIEEARSDFREFAKLTKNQEQGVSMHQVSVELSDELTTR